MANAVAALQGVEQGLAEERFEYWSWKLEQEHPTMREFEDLRAGFQELVLLGVEQALWAQRHRAGATRACRLTVIG